MENGSVSVKLHPNFPITDPQSLGLWFSKCQWKEKICISQIVIKWKNGSYSEKLRGG